MSNENQGFQFFHDGGPYPIETSLFFCSAYQWTDFYIIWTSVVHKNHRINI